MTLFRGSHKLLREGPEFTQEDTLRIQVGHGVDVSQGLTTSFRKTLRKEGVKRLYTEQMTSDNCRNSHRN